MQSYSLSAPELALVAIANPAPGTHSNHAAEVKARAKAIKKIKKQREQEHRRFFFSWCSCLHALGFSF